MSRRIILFLFAFLVLFPGLVFANVVINEIMYDLDGSDIDWVEVYNQDGNIDLSSTKLLISNSTSNHGIIKYSGSQVLHQGDYGIIVPTSQISAFVSKWGSSGNLFTSNFTLPNLKDNEMAKVEINNGDINSPISSVSYDISMGAKSDGNSLQLISGSWLASTPTPGAQNYTPSNSPTETTIASTNLEEDTVVSIPTAKQKIKTKIFTQQIAFVSVPIEFQASVTGYSGETMSYGKYFWNFGDGDSKETRINEGKFFHTYFYPGEYSVGLGYYLTNYADTPEATDKIVIKVVEPNIIISNVGDAGDFFVELINNTNYEADLSSWRVASDRVSFSLPQNTILGSKKKIILSPHITGFSIKDKNSLRLVSPQGKVIYNYSIPVAQVLPVKKTINSPAVQPLKSKEDPILKEDLSATAINSTNENNYVPMFGFILFLGASSSAVYFIRRKKKPILAGDDFELIDE